MKLLTKFNLVLLVFFGISGFVISHMAYQFLMRNARDQVLQQAELMMASAKSTRDYTSEQIKPLLLKNPEHETNFLPQTVPAFAATTMFNAMRKSYPDYSYREATLNPTNLIDRADDWEADLVRYFADHPNDKKLLVSARRRRGVTYTLPSRWSPQQVASNATALQTLRPLR